MPTTLAPSHPRPGMTQRFVGDDAAAAGIAGRLAGDGGWPSRTAYVPDRAGPVVKRVIQAQGEAKRGMTAADLAACEGLMRHGSKSFFAAGRLLPSRVRAPATALYAFCRVADDAIDLAPDPASATGLLAARLDDIYGGRPQPHEADRAFAAVVRCFAIPRALPEALLDGFLWDAQGRRYETLSDVLDYAARVAGSVGAMMALIMGAQGPSALARACELGLAMQLTNIARDVGEDARMGRLYLPRQWMRDAGIDPDRWLAQPEFTSDLGSVVARLLATADSLYQRAALGLSELPRDCRPAIESARSVYREIGRVVEQGGLDSVNRRAVVTGSRKLALVGRSIVAALHVPEADTSPPEPMPAIAYLVDAAAGGRDDELPAFTFYQRTVRIIDLFERTRRGRPMSSQDTRVPLADA